MLQQQTLSEPLSITGSGLHSGNKVKMTFLPAPPNTGIRFRRVDLEGSPEIDALIENVSDTTRSTTLTKGNIKLQTVEHILATFSGYQIDNAIVELDSNEPPIGDGSAREYCKMVKQSGSTLQAEDREPYRVKEPISIQVEDSTMSVVPYDGLRISCTSSDDRGRFTQYYSAEVSPETWEKELSHARTFCFFEEIEFLIKNGLIKGGSLENAVIIRDDVVLTNEPLRYPEEFVRHKILDILGDLSLMGRPLLGHVIAIKPSHKANCELARALDAKWRKEESSKKRFSAPLTQPSKKAEKSSRSDEILVGDSSSMDIDQVMKILPHRYPFLMVDQVLKIDAKRITAVKNVTVNEPYFQGHFPSHPIMPGVLQLEAIAQVAGIVTLNQPENWGKIAYFMSAEGVKWRKPVRPGDTLVIEVEIMKSRRKIGKAKGVCKVNGGEVSEAIVTFMITEG